MSGPRNDPASETGRDALFVACAPGLEDWLDAELAGLGLPASTTRRAVPGGVELGCHREGTYRVALGCGLGLALRRRVARFRARQFSALERHTRAVDWNACLPPDAEPRIKVRSRRSRLYHTGAIAERIARDVAASRAAPSSPRASEVELLVRIEHDECTLSVDLAGDALHRRGYRQATAKAPMREDLARALLVAAGYTPGAALLDPVCGAGTLAIEAACLSEGLPPGHARSFVLQRLPDYDPALFERVAEALRRPAVPGAILASDRDPGAVEATRANAARAGVAHRVEVTRATLSRTPRPQAETGWLVANPPRGRRIGDARTLRNLYAALGNLRRSLGGGWRLALLASDAELARATGLSLESRFLTDQGGAKIRGYVEPAGRS